MSTPLLETRDLTIQYQTENGALTAVSDASITLKEGEYTGLIGESGCGKTTIVRAIMGGLDNNGEVSSGKILYRGEEIQHLSEAKMRERIRWKEISWIPQGAMSSLDPLQRVSEQALEIANTHTELSDEEALEKFTKLFDLVGLSTDRIHDYPFQFSGGMRQRAIMAMALFLEPSVIIADEPTTALDVIMQDKVFSYLERIKDSDIGLMLVTHDISLVFESCDDIVVMHAGQVVERGSVTEIFDSPRHPYSIMLQRAFPDFRYPDRDLTTIDGHPPENIGDVDYCTFADRCPLAVDECREAAPPMEHVGEGGSVHSAACIRIDEAARLHEDDKREVADGSKREHP